MKFFAKLAFIGFKVVYRRSDDRGYLGWNGSLAGKWGGVGGGGVGYEFGGEGRGGF